MSKSKDPNDKIAYYLEKIRKLQNEENRRSSRASSIARNQDVVAEELEHMEVIHSRPPVTELVTTSCANNSPPSPGELPASPGEIQASQKTMNTPTGARPETLKARILRNESITVMAHSSREEPIDCGASLERIKILQIPNIRDERLEKTEYPETLVSKKAATCSKTLRADNLRDEIHVNDVDIIENKDIRSLKKIPRKNIETPSTHKSKNEAKANAEIQGTHSARKEPRTSFDNIQGRSSKKESRTSLETSDGHSSKKRLMSSGEPLEEHNSNKKLRTTSETSDVHDSDNDKSPDITTRLELALGDDLSLGEDINSNLVKVLNPILRKGLSLDQNEKLLKAYSTPANCKLLKAPTLNEEISCVLKSSSRMRDKKMEKKQDQLGLGITAVSKGITLLIKCESDSNTSNNSNSNFKIDAIKHLNHGCRLLADLHHKETTTRKFLCVYEMQNHPVFSNLKFRDLERDDTLYGSKLARMIKRQGIPMTRERVRASHGDQGYQRNGYSTSYTPSSPPRRGEPRSPPILRHHEV